LLQETVPPPLEGCFEGEAGSPFWRVIETFGHGAVRVRIRVREVVLENGRVG
jgi:hypothetical protein